MAACVLFAVVLFCGAGDGVCGIHFVRPGISSSGAASCFARSSLYWRRDDVFVPAVKGA